MTEYRRRTYKELLEDLDVLEILLSKMTYDGNLIAINRAWWYKKTLEGLEFNEFYKKQNEEFEKLKRVIERRKTADDDKEFDS